MDWTCVPTENDDEQLCSYTSNNGELAPGAIPPPLRARVAIADTVTAQSARISATASWTEVQVETGQRGEEGDTAVGWREQEFTDSVDLEVDRPLTVELVSATGEAVHIPAAGGTDAQRTASLVAKIGNIAGRDAKATWSQVAGPSVTFLRSLTVDQPADTTAQRYVIPAGTPDGTELTFRIDAVSNDHAVSDSVTVRVRTHTPGTFSPRTELVNELAAKTRHSADGAKRGVTVKLNNYRGRISGDGVKHVTITPKRARTAKALPLVFQHPAGVKTVKWTVVNGKRSLLKRSVKKRAKLTVRVPKRPGTWLIRGSATLKNGTRVSRTKVVKVDPVRPKRKLSNRSELRVAAADAPSAASFCTLTAGDTVSFADGSSLELPSTFAPPSPCSAKSSQRFTNATFTYNGTTFGSANGLISGSVARLTSVEFELPSQLASALPAGVPTSFTITPPATTPVTAKQTSGVWGAWSGSFAVPWLSFLPVPSGWSTPSGKLILEPTTAKGAVTGAKLSFTQESKAFSKSTSQSTKGAGGHVSFDLTLSSSGPSDVTVNAANLAVFQSGSGNQIEFSGRGKFLLSKGSSNSLTVAMNCSAPVAGNCGLATGFALKNGTSVTWTQAKGLTLAGAEATVGSGANAYTFSLAGTYTSPGSWSLDVQQGGTPWAIGSTGVSMSAFSGSVSEKTTSNSTSQMSIAVTATVDNLNVGSELTVSSMTGNITNQCATDAVNCTPGNISVGIVVDATANFMGDSVEFNATAGLDLSTMTFQFDATETADVDFGPSELNITSATLTLTNESITGSCIPSGNNSAPAGPVLSLGISAQGTAYGTPVDIGGDVNSDGYCLWGAVGDLRSGAFAGNDVVLAYSSYANGATLTLPTNAGDPDAQQASQDTFTLDVAAGMIELQGSYVIPQSSLNALGINGDGTVTFTADADINLSSFTADATFDLQEPVFLGGGQHTDDIGVTLNSVGINIGVSTSPDDASVSFDVGSDIVVASNMPQGGCTADSANASADCSYTPIEGSIGFVLSEDDAQFNVALGITSATNNAFGEAGLDVTALGVAGSFGLDGMSLGVDGAAELPQTWTDEVAVINDAPIAIAFNLSDSNPCIQFSIGEEETGETYLDIANRGVVTANYVALTIAPSGCSIPQGYQTQQIPPGYSFAFDGDILGDTVDVNLSVSFDPTIIDATLIVGGFELAGALDVEETRINFAMNSATDSFDLNFVTGFSLGDPALFGGSINLNGDVISTGPGEFSLVLGGEADIDVAGVVTANVSSNSATCPSWTSTLPQVPTNCLISLQEQGGQLTNLDVSANLAISIMDADINGDVDLIYSDGDLQDLHLSLGAGFNTDVGGVDGNAYIDYCQGTLTDEDHVTGPDSCALGGNTAELRIEVAGSYYVGDCPDFCYESSYHDNIVRTYATTS